ncbi:MAG: hypothetical protein F6K26_40335, partial [Moorea sp. SIO2I5]|nr:hypothetical protein [Moorena sp. SIO2I5]
MKCQVTGKKQEGNINTVYTVLCQFSVAVEMVKSVKVVSMDTVRELHKQLINKERSAVEITQEALDQIQA